MTECLAFNVYIQRRRLELGLSEEQVAQKLGLKGAEAICQVESGQCSLPLDVIPDLADALRLDRTEFCRVFLEKTAIRFNKALFAHEAKRPRAIRRSGEQREPREPMFTEMMITHTGESLFGEIIS